MRCMVIDVKISLSPMSSIICTIYPMAFYKNPLHFDSLSLAFTSLMQGIFVKSHGIFSQNGRESPHKW